MMPKKKSIKQVRFLLSKSSPLGAQQRHTLMEELHNKTVKIVKPRKRRKK